MARPSGRVTVRMIRNAAPAAAKLTRGELEQLVAATTAAVEARAKLRLQEWVYDPPEPNPAQPRTGNLMNTTGSEVNGLEGIVYSSAEYARIVHEGTGLGLNAHPRPWLEQGLADERPEIPNRARRISGGELS